MDHSEEKSECTSVCDEPKKLSTKRFSLKDWSDKTIPNFVSNRIERRTRNRSLVSDIFEDPGGQASEQEKWKDVFKSLNDLPQKKASSLPPTASFGFDQSRRIVDKPEEKKWQGISQENPTFVKWSLVIFVLVIYTTVSTPYLIAIDDGETNINAMFYFDRFLDILFIFDLGIQFLVSYEDPESGQEILEVRLTASHYISFWFWIDLVSIFPYDLLAYVSGGGALGNLSALSIIRMFRMFKLFKLMSIKRMFERMESQYAINYDYLELVKYTLTVFFVLHLLSCGLMIIGKQYSVSWVIENGYEDAGDAEKYVLAAYWATMTLTTIGYGDVVITNSAERMYVIFAMLIGASMYAYVLGGVCGILINMSKDKAEYQSNLSLLNAFMTNIAVPRQMQTMVRNFYARTHQFRKIDQQKEVLTLLSPQLQAVLGAHMHADVILECPYFKGLTGVMVATLSLSLSPQSYGPREALVQSGQAIKELIFLKKGLVMENLILLTVPYTFGKEIILSKPHRANVSVIAVHYCDTLRLSRKSLEDLMDKYPKAEEQIQKEAIKLAFSITTKKIAWEMKQRKIRHIMEYNRQEASHWYSRPQERSSASHVPQRHNNKVEERLEDLENKVDEVLGILRRSGL